MKESNVTQRAEQYAHRILKRLPLYRSVVDRLKESEVLELAVPLRLNERILGCYSLAANGVADAIVITNLSMWHRQDREWRSVLYSEILEVFPPNTKAPLDNVIHLRLRSGAVEQIRIAGHRAQFSDVWEFVRFLDRVAVSSEAQHDPDHG
jgi:hypothetical protein